MKKLSLFNIINGAVMIIICFTMLYPFINTIARSLSSELAITSGQVNLMPVDFTLNAYQKVMFSSSFISALKNSVIITVVGTIISLVVTIAAGFAFSRDLVGKRALFMVVLITMFFSGGMIPLFIQISELGMYNSLWALILPSAFSAYNMILARNYFQTLPDGVLESATIDGCNDLKLLFYIALPMAKPIIATLSLFVAVGYWNVFMAGILYLEDASLYPIQVYVRNVVYGFALSLDQSGAVEQSGQGQLGEESIKAAVLMTTTIPIMIVYPFLQKYFVKGINMGAVKG